jgi:outer membrane immunogenic protein
MTLRTTAVALALLALGATAQAASAGSATYNWTGGYIGGQLGYGWSNTATGETHMYQDAEGTDEYSGSPLPGFSYPGNGFLGGGEIGANWTAGPMVLGLVGDLSAAGIRGTYADDDLGFATDTTINWLGTARVNVGTPMGNWLLYGTGGLAFGGVTAGLHDTYDDDVVNSSATSTNVGWTIGAGIATGLSSHWVLKAEYLYVDLGSHNYSFSEPDPPGFPLITSSARVTANILKASLDYKF